MAADEVRVVLVKPGDTLIFGNVGFDVDPDSMSSACNWLTDKLGLRGVVVFAEDIDMAALCPRDPENGA